MPSKAKAPSLAPAEIASAKKAKSLKSPPMSELDAWLAAHSSEYTLLPSGKLHCSATSTDLPLSLPILTAHWAGPAYRRALRAAVPLDLSLYPHVVPHRSLPSRLYCTLTAVTLNARVDEVEAHVRGRRYVAALRRREEREREREERERRRRERRERSGKDDDVEARLPAELLGDEEEEEVDDGEGEGEGEDAEAVSEDDEAGEEIGRVLVREVEEDDGMPVVRKKRVALKRSRPQEEEEEEDGQEDEEQQQNDEEKKDEEPVTASAKPLRAGKASSGATNGHPAKAAKTARGSRQAQQPLNGGGDQRDESEDATKGPARLRQADKGKVNGRGGEKAARGSARRSR